MSKTARVDAMTAETYWRLKAAVLQVELAQEQARQRLAPVQAVLAEAMRQAGLDPSVEYRLDDATASVVPVSPPDESRP
jgi:hypothetical protein